VIISIAIHRIPAPHSLLLWQASRPTPSTIVHWVDGCTSIVSCVL